MSRRTKRADGLLQKTFRVEVNGVKKQFAVYGHTEQELSEKEQKKRLEIAKGIEKRENPTVSEYYETWLKGRRATVSEATIRTQGKFFGVVSKIKLSDASNMAFGDMKIKSVKKEDLLSLRDELSKARKTQTVNDYMALIKHIFTDAFEDDFLEKNPFKGISNLKRTEEKARDTHHRALTKEETALFFGNERCKNSFYYNVFRFAINTGLRAGEIGALRYSDIKNDTLHVQRTITRTEGGAYIIGEDAKTKAGRRDIPMNSIIRDIVAEQKKINHILDGGVVAIDDLLFKAVERGLLMATPIDREIKRICAAAGIEPFTMHAFRDTFATRAIESGMNPKTLQEILGHSNYNITMSLYGHVMPDTKKHEMEKIAIAI